MYYDKEEYISNIKYYDIPLTNNEILRLLNKLTKEQIEKKQERLNMFKELGIDESIRGEKLSLEDYAKIADYIENT